MSALTVAIITVCRPQSGKPTTVPFAVASFRRILDAAGVEFIDEKWR
jgi:hypothetical protein